MLLSFLGCRSLILHFFFGLGHWSTCLFGFLSSLWLRLNLLRDFFAVLDFFVLLSIVLVVIIGLIDCIIGSRLLLCCLSVLYFFHFIRS